MQRRSSTTLREQGFGVDMVAPRKKAPPRAGANDGTNMNSPSVRAARTTEAANIASSFKKREDERRQKTNKRNDGGRSTAKETNAEEAKMEKQGETGGGGEAQERARKEDRGHRVP